MNRKLYVVTTTLESVVLATSIEEARKIAADNSSDISCESDLSRHFTWEAYECETIPKNWEGYCLPWTKDGYNPTELSVHEWLTKCKENKNA